MGANGVLHRNIFPKKTECFTLGDGRRRRNLVIREAEADDIDAMAEMEKKSFPGLTAYSKRQLKYLAFKANSIALVDIETGVLRGFIIVLYRKGSRVGGVDTITVDPRFRKQGVGPRLLAAAEEDMKKRGIKFSQLEVSQGNETAISLYRKAGYIANQKLPGFYKFEHNGTRDAVRMVKALE